MNDHQMVQTMTNLDQQTDKALHEQWDWLRVTLSCIGDAVITTDTNGDVTFLNPVAQSLTGWTQVDAAGKPLDAVFKIVNETTRKTVENPAFKALREGIAVGLANHTLLIAKDGTEWPIDDSAAPIRNATGEVAGVVLVFRDVTERKQQERLAQSALAYADNIIATLRHPFLVLDSNLRVVTANRSFYENFQVTPDESQGRFIYDLGNRQWDIPQLRTLLEDVLPQNHAFQDFDVEHDFPTIGRKFMQLNARRIRKPGNNSELILLAIEDITDRKQQKKLVQDALAYADNIIATLREPFLVLDSDLKVVTANHSFYQNFHVTLEESQGHFIYDLGNRQWDIPQLRTLLEDVLPQNHAFQDFELEHDFPTIGQKTMLLNARRIRKPGNNSELILLAIEDVTERRETQRLLEVSETRFRRLFESAHDGILILDAANRQITHVNPFLTGLLDYPAEHFLGKELWEIGFLGDKLASQSAMQQLNEQGSLRYESLPLEDRHGAKHPVEMVANLYQEDHHPVIQCNIRDIADRSRLEMLQREQAAELSDLHRRKDEFLAMLSHELRSPLAPIANAVELLSLQSATETLIQKQARSIIERQMRQLQRLVDDLLEVSRITTGRVQLRRERVVVSRIVEVGVETVRPLIEQRGHELTVSLPPEPIWLNADVMRLEQVVANLLTNSAKYTPEGGHIWLTVRQENDQCVLRVRDTGVGISAELLPHVFDLFTQAERSLDRSQGGLGIGLALVQRLTELHDGTVAANSELGQGSEFIVRLPVAPPDATQPPSLNSETIPPTTRPLRVLVVDDNVDTVLGFSMLLRASGHEVRTAHDGLAAVQAALDYQPDVVLLDIGLPVLNGYEVAKRIRQEPALKNIVLVALTGYGQEADRQTALQAGFNHHLVKPARLAQLLEILATVSAQVT